MSSDMLTLSAEARERAGKGASRAIRREGRIPAVIYGDKQDPVTIHVAERELMKLLHTGHFMNSLVEIDLGGSKSRTLPKDIQLHPVNDRPLHVDFLRIGKGATVTVEIRVNFIDEEESPGIKRGGVLNVVRHELELNCPADSIPEEITISLAGMDIGDSVHISDVTLPEGVTSAIDDRDFTIAGVVAPSILRKEDDEAAESEDGEDVAADEVPATEQEGDDEGEDKGKGE